VNAEVKGSVKNNNAERHLSLFYSFSFERQAMQGGYVSGEARVHQYVSETEYICPTRQSDVYQTKKRTASKDSP